jgi:hypothetical protein
MNSENDMRYITLSQMRQSAPGLPEIDGTAGQRLPDISLANYINKAETLVDAYCGIDMKQSGGFDPHTITVFAQSFDYNTRRTRFPVPPVPIRSVLAYRIVISTSSPSGEPLVATLSPFDIVINEYDGWCEAVPLTAVTYAVSPVLAQLGLTQPMVQMEATVGYYLPIFNETLIDLGDHLTYQASQGFWAATYDMALQNRPQTQQLPIPANVYVNGALQTSGYTLNLTEGQVVFGSSQAGNVIAADYTHVIPSNVREATQAQVEYFIGQRRLNQLGMAGIEMIRNGDQQVKRHLRSSGGNNSLDSEEMAPRAQRLLAGYRNIPIA